MQSELTALVEQWRAREAALCRRADAQASTQYAHRLAAEAEGIARCADQLEAVLAKAGSSLPESGPQVTEQA